MMSNDNNNKVINTLTFTKKLNDEQKEDLKRGILLGKTKLYFSDLVFNDTMEKQSIDVTSKAIKAKWEREYSKFAKENKELLFSIEKEIVNIILSNLQKDYGGELKDTKIIKVNNYSYLNDLEKRLAKDDSERTITLLMKIIDEIINHEVLLNPTFTKDDLDFLKNEGIQKFIDEILIDK